jgi:hypothetical protein
MLTGLEQNKTYTISFWLQAYASGVHFGGTEIYYPPIPPFVVSLGSQVAPPILLPANYLCFNTACADWVKKSVTFTHTDPGSSALLTFTQHMNGVYIPKRDIPLGTNVHSQDRIFISMDGGGIAEEPSQGPTLSVQKALNGNRGANTDQFTVQILNASAVINATTKSTTTGNNATVDNGTGTTGATTLTAGTSYKIAEVVIDNTNLGGYSSTLACINSTGTTVPTALNTAFTLSNTDAVSCTITNKALPATLALRQLVLRPVPINIVAPYTFSYTGNNGWTTQPVTNVSEGTLASGLTQTLTAFNTATTLSAIMPDRWSVSTFSCADINAAVSGNPTGTLVIVNKVNTLTIPAANVRPGANLRCTSMLSRLTP